MPEYWVVKSGIKPRKLRNPSVTDRPIGFFSIVRKPQDESANLLTVRARVREDLEAFARRCPELGPIETSEWTDYAFRARGPAQAVAATVGALTAGIDYSNFKDQVAWKQGKERARVYREVWDTLYGLQRRGR
jgi:hypothetical protein